MRTIKRNIDITDKYRKIHPLLTVCCKSLLMNDKNFELAKELIPSTYVDQGRDAIKRREKQVTELLSHKKIPEIGWDDQSIEYI